MSAAYVPPKWRVVYGSAQGPEGFALAEICGRLAFELDENIPCVKGSDFTVEDPEQNILLMGTPESNPLISPYISEIPAVSQGYLIKTVENAELSKATVLVVAGFDASGSLYGVMDFIHRYADGLANPDSYRERKPRPFIDPLPEISLASYPKISKRGIWTWGRCIYDYRGFFDNMARTKMNTAVIWNDVPPVNGTEIVRYAHSRGVKIVWGFSWGWSVDAAADIASEASLEEWKARIVSEYENVWAPLGGDGIYFQTATECDERVVNGLPLAAHVVKWVNGIAGAMYEKFPDLDIEFGLHATSVKTSTEYLAAVDPRLTVTWEDGGAFPFSYHANDTENFEETLELTDKMLALRGDAEKAGFVLKGIRSLFWPEFRYARDSFVLGQASEEFIQKKLAQVKNDIRTEQAGWLANLGNLTQVAKRLAASGKVSGSVTVLCEDGCFERARWIPCILFGDALWSPETSTGELIKNAALCRDGVFA